MVPEPLLDEIRPKQQGWAILMLDSLRTSIIVLFQSYRLSVSLVLFYIICKKDHKDLLEMVSFATRKKIIVTYEQSFWKNNIIKYRNFFNMFLIIIVFKLFASKININLSWYT